MQQESTEGQATQGKWLDRNFELVIAILLGIASIVTAWASYQSSLYTGEMTTANTKAGVLAAEAESLYLEGNQQFANDAQLFNRLSELDVQAESEDAAAAAVAVESAEVLRFQSLSDDFAAAMEWAEAENAADSGVFTHPQASEEYSEALFGEYEKVKADADAQLERAGSLSALSDRLSLNTVLLAIALFLFGIAALLRTQRTRMLVTAVATVVMVVATVMTVMVVTTPLA